MKEYFDGCEILDDDYEDLDEDQADLMRMIDAYRGDLEGIADELDNVSSEEFKREVMKLVLKELESKEQIRLEDDIPEVLILNEAISESGSKNNEVLPF